MPEELPAQVGVCGEVIPGRAEPGEERREKARERRREKGLSND